MPIEIVPLEPHHWDRVRAIYLDGLATGQAGFETQAPGWPEWDAAHLKHSRLVAVRTAEDGGREASGTRPQVEGGGRDTEDAIVGWVALSRVSTRQCYAGVAEVSIYVASEARGKRIGTRLLDAAVRTSEAAGIWTLVAVVFPENSASVRLHERCGFRVVGRRERIARRDGIWHDTLVMERRSRVIGQ